MNKFVKEPSQKVNLSTPPQQILRMIMIAREKKYKSSETLQLINKAIDITHDYIVNLYFEQVHVYQLIYMTERDKLGKGSKTRLKAALLNMEKYTKVTEKYILENDLSRWLHRLYRFYGKVGEYKRNYKSAVDYYKKSLKFWKSDPEVIAKSLPRNLELEGFLSSAIIMSGESEKGLKMARKVYKKYDTTQEGKNLKNVDYTTWAIWRSGVPIFVARAYLEVKTNFDRKEILAWLEEALRYLNPPKSIKTWADFRYRKDEIIALKNILRKS